MKAPFVEEQSTLLFKAEPGKQQNISGYDDLSVMIEDDNSFLSKHLGDTKGGESEIISILYEQN